MKNLFKTSYLGITIVSLTLLSLLGCTKSPENNHPPVVKNLENKHVNRGDMVNLRASVSDMDKDDKLSYFWTLVEKPKGSEVTLKDKKKKAIAFRPDRSGVYRLTFTITDTIVTNKKTVTVTVVSIVGEWKANLAKTKEKNNLNESQTAEVVEILSTNYKYNFLENGNVEGSTSGSWKYTKDKNYSIDNSTKIKMETFNEFFVIHSLKDGKEVKLYYSKIFKK